MVEKFREKKGAHFSSAFLPFLSFLDNEGMIPSVNIARSQFSIIKYRRPRPNLDSASGASARLFSKRAGNSTLSRAQVFACLPARQWHLPTFLPFSFISSIHFPRRVKINKHRYIFSPPFPLFFPFLSFSLSLTY